MTAVVQVTIVAMCACANPSSMLMLGAQKSLTVCCVLERACKALLAHGLAWPRPCRRKLEDGGGCADERMWVIDDCVVQSTSTYSKFAELPVDPCM